MSFDEVRLPEDIERGAVGGPGFNTTVLTLFSGHERRNQNWAVIKGKYDISYGITTRSQLAGAINFFYTRRGMNRGFRFKDWGDFQIGDTFTNDPTTRQAIGEGDTSNTLFQVFKQYEDGGGFTFDRPLKKLVDGTVKVYLGSTLQVAGYTVNHNTGLITFSSAPGMGVIVSVICEFDVPVRFDTDMLKINTEVFADEAKMQLPQINLVEVRV